MKFLDLTLETAQKNLACDEALLDLAEEGSGDEILRFWEPQDYFVVLGYSNKIFSEVNVNSCRAKHIPILRRASGGGTVLQGPGCLNYSVILRIDTRPEIHSITATNSFIMRTHQEALQPLLGNIEAQGISDLTLKSLKFSGNAQRRKRHYLLYHGTFLFGFDFNRVEEYLAMPSRQPEYRNNRPHKDFLVNLPLSRETLKKALQEAWKAQNDPFKVPADRIDQLARERYNLPEWNEKF